MTPREPNSPGEDHTFDEVTSAFHEASTEQPPELVDLAVLNRARAAVEGRHAWFWNMRWVHGLTTVGVIALAVTLIHEYRESTAPPAGALEPPALRKQAPAEMLRDRRADKDEPGTVQDALERQPSAAAKLAEPAAGAQAFGETRATAPAAPAPAQRELEAPVTEEKATSEQNGLSEDPEAWLARIRALRQAGDEEAARKSLAKFRKAWPDYPLPEDLRE